MIRTLAILCAVAVSVASSAAEGFDARFAVAVARAESGDHVAALTAFEDLARDYPTRPEPLNNLAAELARRGDLVRAREVLERALRTDPAYATAHDNLRTIYAALASDAYRKALPVGAEPAVAPELALIAKAAPEPVLIAATAAPRVAAAPVSVPNAAPSVTHAAIAPAPQRGVAASSDPGIGRAFAAFAAVDAWAKAWASKDVAGYLAAYGAAFAPPDGLSRAAWEAQRAERIRAPKQIAVTLAQRDLLLDPDGEHATMMFMQSYRSDRFNGSAWKTLDLERKGARWLIVAERAGR